VQKEITGDFLGFNQRKFIASYNGLLSNAAWKQFYCGPNEFNPPHKINYFRFFP